MQECSLGFNEAQLFCDRFQFLLPISIITELLLMQLHKYQKQSKNIVYIKEIKISKLPLHSPKQHHSKSKASFNAFTMIYKTESAPSYYGTLACRIQECNVKMSQHENNLSWGAHHMVCKDAKM